MVHLTSISDGLNANGTVSVLNSDRLESPTGPLDIIHGYAVLSDTVGQLTVHLQTVPVPAPCKGLLGYNNFNGGSSKLYLCVWNDNLGYRNDNQ